MRRTTWEVYQIRPEEVVKCQITAEQAYVKDGALVFVDGPNAEVGTLVAAFNDWHSVARVTGMI